MCAECRQSPCHSSCPNADTDYLKCTNCKNEITSDFYYQDSEYNVFCCEDCVLEFFGVSEKWGSDICDDYDDYDFYNEED